ncbi:MAG: hypothetical protein WDW20_03330 [Neisseriaceae bacterium]
MSLDIAWCAELGMVTIREVTKAYFSREPEERRPFDLRCPDSTCVQSTGQRTQLSARNAYIPEDDLIAFRSRHPHFALFPRQQHHSNCAYSGTQQKDEAAGIKPPAATEKHPSKLKSHYSCIATKFVRPGTEELNQGVHTYLCNSATDANTIGSASNYEQVKEVASDTDKHKRSSYCVNTLEGLVASYKFAQKEVVAGRMDWKEFAKLKFTISREGSYRYKDFF